MADVILVRAGLAFKAHCCHIYVPKPSCRVWRMNISLLHNVQMFWLTHSGQKHHHYSNYSAGIMTSWLWWLIWFCLETCLCMIPWILAVFEAEGTQIRVRSWQLPACTSCSLQNSIEAPNTAGVKAPWICAQMDWNSHSDRNNTATQWKYLQGTEGFPQLPPFWLPSLHSENYNFFLFHILLLWLRKYLLLRV